MRSLLLFGDVVGLRKKNNYLLTQIESTNGTPMYFDMPFSYTGSDTGVKTALIRMCYEKMRVSLLVAVIADGSIIRDFDL